MLVHQRVLAFHPSFHLQGKNRFFPGHRAVFPRSKLSEAVEACQKEKHQAGDLKSSGDGSCSPGEAQS